MTLALPDSTVMPDLDAVVACECGGHDETGCQREATLLTWNSPCGHEPEALCEPCTATTVELIGHDCPDCGGDLTCNVCDAVVTGIGRRPL